jgi:hypothetical protein
MRTLKFSNSLGAGDIAVRPSRNAVHPRLEVVQQMAPNLQQLQQMAQQQCCKMPHKSGGDLRNPSVAGVFQSGFECSCVVFVLPLK